MRYSVPWLSFIVILSCGSAASAQTDPTVSRTVKRLQPLRITETIVIDGRLVEPAWALAEVGRDFSQQEPDQGALTSAAGRPDQRTFAVKHTLMLAF